MNFDFTLFETDDETPFFGTGDGSGGVTVADFSTDPTHDRPYLDIVSDWSATEIDFKRGSSTIGGLRVDILDKRTDPTDQDTGIVTSVLSRIVGKRALLRRESPTTPGTMLTAFMGVVTSYSMGGSADGLVTVTLSLRDIRERERSNPSFQSNFVIYGLNGASGPLDGYGELPISRLRAWGASYLLNPVAPALSAVVPGASHFQRESEAVPADGIYYGFIGLPRNESNPWNLGELAAPSPNGDGTFFYPRFQIAWRDAAAAVDDPWITLSDMPRAVDVPAVYDPERPAWEEVILRSYPLLYFGSTTEADIPADGQAIQYKILASEITSDTPFFWDGGTFGDLLKAIYDGDFGGTPVPYNVAAMTSFAANTPTARFILTEPVDDMRKWVEQNIYQALGYAPAFDEDGKIVPVPWTLPSDPTAVPVIESASVRPIGNWEHDSSSVVNQVEYKYVREGVETPEKTQYHKGRRKYLFFGPRETTKIEDTRSEWERYFVEDVIVEHVDADSVATFGYKPLKLAPVTVRALGFADGRPREGNVMDETGARIAERLSTDLLFRFRTGAPGLEGDFSANDPVVRDLMLGDWVRVYVPWFPEYATGERGARRYMQVRSIDDTNPILRRISLIDGGITDHEADPEIVSGEDCLGSLSTGTPALIPDGRRGLVFATDGEVVNSCAHPVTVRALLIAGGGDVGASVAPGGGGAGGVAGGSEGAPLLITIAANQTIPVTIGLAGVAGSGGHSVIWCDRITGLALDPMTDDPDDGYMARGGGRGGELPHQGGSGGGGGGDEPISGGATHNGGLANGSSAQAVQGSNGGDGEDAGGLATCQRSAGGGGGSWGGGGGNGTTGIVTRGGDGGPNRYLPEWGVWAGGGGAGGAVDTVTGGVCPDDPPEPGYHGGPGYGQGGGGGMDPEDENYDPAFSGVAGDGIVIIAYAGATAPTLEPPTLEPGTVNPDGSIEICVTAANWPVLDLPDYSVRVEYAVADVAPDADSSAWLTAGYLEEPGCLTIPALPPGPVHVRAVAEADDFLPSEPATPTEETVPETAGLLGYALTADRTGLATAEWTENPFTEAVRLRGLVHAQGDDITPPLPLITQLLAGVGTYEHDELIPQEEYFTLDIETYAGYEAPVTAPVFADEFTGSDGTSIGNGWTERAGDWERASNRLVMASATTNRAIEQTGISRGEMFIQATLRAVDAAAWPSVVARFNWNGGAPQGYEFEIRPGTDTARLRTLPASALGALNAGEDGMVYDAAFSGCRGLWAAVQAGAGTSTGFDRTAGFTQVEIQSCVTSGQYNRIGRSIFCFTISSLTNVGEAARIILRENGIVNTLAGQQLCLVGATPASDTTLVAADYATVGSTLYSDTLYDVDSLSTPQLLTFDLNAAGLAALEAARLAGTKFCVAVRAESDRTNVEPTWAASQTMRVTFDSFNAATAGNRPQLIVDASALDSDAPALTVDTDHVVQLYVKDGQQTAHVAGTTLTGTDTTYDGQNTRSAAIRHNLSGIASVTSQADDFRVYAHNKVIVTGLPTGYKAKILNSGESVVASATESGGTATIDASQAGGATEPVPAAGWASLLVTDGADVEIDRWDGAVYPGFTHAFDEDTMSLTLRDQGRTYRRSVLNPLQTTPEFDLSAPVNGDIFTYADGVWVNAPEIAHANLPTGGGTWADAGDLAIDATHLRVDGFVAVSQMFLTGSPATFSGLLADLASANSSGDPQALRGQQVGTDNQNAQAVLHVGASTNGGGLVLAKTRAGTLAAVAAGTRAILSSGDTIGSLTWAGDDGVDVATHAARIAGVVDGTPSANRMPGRIVFYTAEGAADDDSAIKATLTATGILSVSLGITPIATLGAGIEIAKATGDAAPAPAYLRLRSTTSGGAWSTVDPWAVVDFYSNDPTGFGAGVRARIGAIMSASTGAATHLAFFTASATTFAERWRVTNNGVFQSSGAQTIQTSTGTLTISTAAGNGDVLVTPHGTGKIVMGHTASIAVGTAAITPLVQVLGVDQNTGSLLIGRWTAGTGGTFFGQSRSRSAAIGGFASLQDGDTVGSHRWYGSDGTDLATEVARIAVGVSGSPSTSQIPGRMDFSTAAGLAADDLSIKWSILPTGIWEATGAQTIRTSTGNLTLSSIAGDGSVVLTPHRAGVVQVAISRTLTAGVTDGYGLRFTPTYTGAFTVTRHNYLDVNNPVLASGAAVTDAALVRFDAAAGTHKALVGATTKTTPGGVDAWIKININGTLAYVPAYLSTTA